jgi:hypothetical protein
MSVDEESCGMVATRSVIILSRPHAELVNIGSLRVTWCEAAVR